MFILESDAQLLRNHVSRTLWTTAEVGRVRGQLSSITTSPRSPEEASWLGEFESQVMGWLGDGDSYHLDQAERLAEGTFTAVSGNRTDRRYVEQLAQNVLERLEQRGFVVAASPYQLTDRGARARLTGLNSDSVTRLEAALAVGHDAWMPRLVDSVVLSDSDCEQVARTVFVVRDTEPVPMTTATQDRHTDGSTCSFRPDMTFDDQSLDPRILGRSQCHRPLDGRRAIRGNR